MRMDNDQSIASYASTNLHKYQTNSRLYQWHLREFQRVISDLLLSFDTRTILDAGCGEGFLIEHLAEQNRNWKITGLELEAGAVAYARAHFGDYATFRTGNLYRLPFSDRSFDTVICSQVLEHLDDPERAVVELKRVARKQVLITVPLEPYFKWLNNLGRALGLSPDPGHVQFWTAEGFEGFIEKQFSQAIFRRKHIYQLALAEL